MNKLFKYLLILLSLGLVVIPVIYTIMLFKASQAQLTIHLMEVTRTVNPIYEIPKLTLQKIQYRFYF